MPAPLAALKAAQVAKAALDKSGISPGMLVVGGGLMFLFGPITLVVVLVLLTSSFFGGNRGADPQACQLSMGNGVVVPANYSFSLPSWDPDPAKRDRTKNPNTIPGPVPQTYDNRGKSVPYLGYLQAAEKKYNVPWYMLAAISWQETTHGSDATTWDHNATSDHSYGPMQFIPGTWGAYKVDGDGDGVADDDSVGDQIFAAANLLVRNGFLEGQAGVLRAIGAYNPHETYKNDVLFWAQKYASGAGGTTTVNNTICNSLDSGAISKVIRFVLGQVGKSYVWGAEGPDSFDCSGLMFAAFRTVGVTLPRRAVDQSESDLVEIVARSPVDPKQLIPGDMLFIQTSNRDANNYSAKFNAYIAHVAIYIGNGEVVEASSPEVGIIRSTYTANGWSRVVAAGRVKGIVQAGGASGPWNAPVVGATPSSGFGKRDNPTGPGTEIHNGQDLAAPCGTPIYAVADGTVLLAGAASGYGNYIVIDHGSGFHTGYGHEQALYVHQNDQVRKGQHIADVGNLGRSVRCHLHFNTVEGAFEGPWSGTYVDPHPLLVQHGVNYWG
jgi:cell wall-associated NlpC family hydrolase